jgi:hypothetical protein
MRARLADGDDYAAVVGMLEEVRRHIPPDDAYDADLAASCAELAKRALVRKDDEEALRHAERALELAPTATGVRRVASAVMVKLAGRLLDEGSEAARRRALALFQRSQALDAEP